MIIALTVTNDDQQRIAEEALSERHLKLEIVTYKIHQDMEEQLLGRDSIAHHARHQAQQGLQHITKATYGVALAAGIDMTPEGIFLVCAAVGLSRAGRQVVGWSTPRLIPETVSQEISTGGKLDQLMENYKQQWKPVDVISLPDIDELISRHASYSEALASALDALFQTRA